MNNISYDNNTTIVKKVNITSDNSITNDFNISLVNNKNNKLLYDDLTNKDVNISKNIKSDNITVVNKINNHELSKFNNTTDINNSSVINVYPNTSDLVNNSSVKYNKSKVLFNDTSYNLTQYNRSSKVLSLINDSSNNDNVGSINSHDINSKPDSKITVNQFNNESDDNTKDIINILINNSVNFKSNIIGNKPVNDLITVDKDKSSSVLFNNTLNNTNKDNKSLINLSDDSNFNTHSLNNTVNSNLSNNSLHHNKTKLINLSTDKYNKSNVLFNDTLPNQSQFNKSFKVFGLDKDSSVNDKLIGLTNDSISKKIKYSSEINNISNNSSSKDNHINHVSEPQQDKDYIMLLIPILLVLLGAIILYNKKQ